MQLHTLLRSLVTIEAGFIPNSILIICCFSPKKNRAVPGRMFSCKEQEEQVSLCEGAYRTLVSILEEENLVS